MEKKLLLINPKNYSYDGIYKTGDYSVPPLGLAMIAALTPVHWSIEILDENLQDFSFQEADLVGFTALTSQVRRAYKISEMYREKKIPTVIGGIHASMMPDEASKFFDIVVVGEA